MENNPVIFPNNVNTILQQDMRGNQQNVAYFDADDGMQIGPNDPRITLINQVPLNMFRPHVFSDFNELELDSKWSFKPYQNGNCLMGNGCATIACGEINGSGGRLEMPNVPVPFVPGQRVYFYLMTTPNGNLNLEFGIAGTSQFAKFTRSEDNVAQPYSCKTQSANGVGNAITAIPGNSIRRLFCISIEPAGVRYYIGTDMGELREAAFYPEIPSGSGRIFIDFKNLYPARREVSVDVVYAVLIR